MGGGYSSDSDTSLNPILELLKDVKKDVRITRDEVAGINREVGGIQVTLTTIQTANERQDTDIKEIRDRQANCTARTGYVGSNARIKKLEGKDKEITGSIDVVAQRQQAVELTLKKNGNGVSFNDAFKRLLPWFIVAVITGASLGGYALATMLMGGSY